MVDSLPQPVLDRAFRGHQGPVRAVKFHPNMHQLISCASDTVFCWHFKPQLRPHRFTAHQAEVLDLCVSSDGGLIASGSGDKTVRLWKNSSKGESVQIKAHTGPVRSVSFSADDAHLVTASDDKVIKIWSTNTRKFQSSFDGHTNWIRCARFAPDRSTMIVSCGDDKAVKIWDAREKKCIMSFHDHVDTVNKALFHPDGSCVAACSEDNSIKLWDIRAKRLLQHYDAHAGPVTDISFEQSGILLSASLDQTVKLWDLKEGRLNFTARGHDGPVLSCAFSAQGGYFASGGQDSLVHVWRSSLESTEVLFANDSTVLAERNGWGNVVRNPPKHAGFASEWTERNPQKVGNFPSKKAQSCPIPLSVRRTAHITERENVPVQPEVPNAPQFQKTLNDMSSQISVLVRTVKLLEERMKLQEQKIDAFVTRSSANSKPSPRPQKN